MEYVEPVVLHCKLSRNSCL
ncbi:hypothetical protein Godav_025770 [Gossypium davidsonii]|uniref:Uncharacterized protein n=2 Tax=Gossypium TaxID=3633 RepID=A0A7J8T8H6_GOSDV|nr:hypothetical protein [Gossypium davidsonii]MBA0660949.1 hypothetical protein [Gossypium klotzschianum]